MGRKKTSVKDLEKKALEGDAQAAASLGLLYEIGLEVPANEEKAKGFQNQAAEGGDLYARLSSAHKSGKPIASKASEPSASGVQMPVLVVDPSRSSRMTIRSLLEELGYSVHEAMDAREAVGVLKMNPDMRMMFTEVNLPGVSASQLLTKLRSHKSFRSLPIVVVTAVTTPEVIAKVKKSGINGWIVKPYNQQVIKKSTDRWIKNQS